MSTDNNLLEDLLWDMEGAFTEKSVAQAQQEINSHILETALELIGEDESGAVEDFAKRRQSHNNALRVELRQAFKDKYEGR